MGPFRVNKFIQTYVQFSVGMEIQLFEVQWPTWSPDITPLDFCLWGWMKSEVYKEKVNTRDEFVARTMNTAAHLK
jgi:hypothetical protein